MQGVQHVQGFSSYNNKSLKSLMVQITLHTLQPCIKLNKTWLCAQALPPQRCTGYPTRSSAAATLMPSKIMRWEVFVF